jgi:hypothetical protein
VRRGRSAAPALIDDDGFGEAILRAHAIFAPEELEEAETALEFSMREVSCAWKRRGVRWVAGLDLVVAATGCD